MVDERSSRLQTSPSAAGLTKEAAAALVGHAGSHNGKAHPNGTVGRSPSRISTKWASLAALVLQTTWQAHVVSIARAGGTKYLNSSAVFFVEMLKTIISLALLTREEGGLNAAFQRLRQNSGWEMVKVSVPAIMYTIQNNLILVSLDNLSAAVQQVTYQLKILAAASLMRVMLGKQLTYTKWCSLLILVVGVWLIQWPSDADKWTSSRDTAGRDSMLGFVAVVAACCASGFAGVYTEMLLKQPNISIWLRNVQMGFVGSFAALVGAFVQDWAEIQKAGLTQGYSWRVLLLIATTSWGGLLVAVVLKYADNILRQFSTALSIILTSIVSAIVVRDVELCPLFVLGTFLTIGATFMYNLGLPVRLYAGKAL